MWSEMARMGGPRQLKRSVSKSFLGAEDQAYGKKAKHASSALVFGKEVMKCSPDFKPPLMGVEPRFTPTARSGRSVIVVPRGRWLRRMFHRGA